MSGVSQSPSLVFVRSSASNLQPGDVSLGTRREGGKEEGRAEKLNHGEARRRVFCWLHKLRPPRIGEGMALTLLTVYRLSAACKLLH
jgi:hypothetical protein